MDEPHGSLHLTALSDCLSIQFRLDGAESRAIPKVWDTYTRSMERVNVRSRALRKANALTIAVVALATAPLAFLASTAQADGITWTTRTSAADILWF